MKIKIDTKLLKKNDFTISDFLICFAIKLCQKRDILVHIEELVQKKIIFFSEHLQRYVLTNDYEKRINDILLNSEDVDMSDEELASLINQMKEYFPSGKKPGTSVPWKDSTKTLISRMKLYFRFFGNKKPEDILQATKEYVSSFNGNYTNMRILKYFIIKTDDDGCKISDLDSCIENLGNNTNQYNYDSSEMI